MVTQRILDFLSSRNVDGPTLVLDLEKVRDNYLRFAHTMPDSDIFYAVKANPAPEILRLLTSLGCCFDVASITEIEQVLDSGAAANRISYGNTVKKERDVERAHALGVSLFAVDCLEEVEKISRAAPGARVFCRLLTDGSGAEWPLSRKFGCTPEMAVCSLEHAHKLGLTAHGVSFHVGSQQLDVQAWDRAVRDAAQVFHDCARRGVELAMVNLGGGFPARYLRDIPDIEAYSEAISHAICYHFGNSVPETILEPGRGLVGEAGVIRSEVVLITRKSPEDSLRWVYLDIGKFGGLAETMEEAIRYPIRTARDGEPSGPCVIAGPTCDSADVLYERTPYDLPVGLAIGDEVLIESSGAYTTTYSSVGFNGFAPLAVFLI